MSRSYRKVPIIAGCDSDWRKAASRIARRGNRQMLKKWWHDDKINLITYNREFTEAYEREVNSGYFGHYNDVKADNGWQMYGWNSWKWKSEYIKERVEEYNKLMRK